MATQTNLELNVKAQAKNLDPAQKEFVLAELKTYMWNARRISKIEKILEGESDEVKLADQDKLFKQRHQLVAENSALFSHIMRWLKGTATEKSALDEFLES